jgi:hypothetical protein
VAIAQPESATTSDVAVRIPRRPQIPGIPGLPLPGYQAPIEEFSVFASSDAEDEPTRQFRAPPQSGTIPRAKSLTVNGLTKDEAGQLAGIIAAWETMDPTGRLLLAEFARRLARK